MFGLCEQIPGGKNGGFFLSYKTVRRKKAAGNIADKRRNEKREANRIIINLERLKIKIS